jgi:hypothetical protein
MPAASVPAPPGGAFNELTFAGAKSNANPRRYAPGNHAPALLRQLPWRGHPCHCATLCGVVSNRPAALYHPLPYGWRTAPSKKDGGALEWMTHDYSAPARDGAVTSGQWERSPPSPSALCDHPRHCTTIPDVVGACGDGTPPRAATVPCTASCQRHPRILTRAALERATSTPPPPLEAAPGRAQDTP